MGEPEKDSLQWISSEGNLMPSLADSELTKLEKRVCARIIDAWNRGATVFPKLFSDQFADDMRLDPVTVDTMRDAIVIALATEEVKDAQELADALADFLEAETEEEEDRYRETARKYIEKLEIPTDEQDEARHLEKMKRELDSIGAAEKFCLLPTRELKTPEGLEKFIDIKRRDGGFRISAAHKLYIGELIIYEDASDTVMAALCSAYVLLEKNLLKDMVPDFSCISMAFHGNRVTQDEFMRLYATLKGALKMREIDYPDCARQKGGRARIEERDDFRMTIESAILAAGGFEAWNRKTADQQITAIMESSKEHGKGIGLSSARDWRRRAKGAGLFEVKKTETQN